LDSLILFALEVLRRQ